MFKMKLEDGTVSTHSRLKAAGSIFLATVFSLAEFQHTAA